MIALLTTGIALHGVIDQIDEGVAAVEWSSDAFGFLPLSALPADSHEGDRIQVDLLPAGSGEAVACSALQLDGDRCWVHVSRLPALSTGPLATEPLSTSPLAQPQGVQP